MANTERAVIGMILKGYPRISETFISNEILLLESLGFRIRIISMRQPREAFSHDNVRNIKARADYLPSTFWTSLHRLLPPFFELLRQKPRQACAALGLAWRRFKRTRKPATFKHLLQGAHVARRILPGSGISHLHAHFAHSPASVAMFASVLAQVPFSFTAHAKDIWTQEPSQLAEKIDRARFVVTCTLTNQAYLASLDTGRTPVRTVYHGIDLNYFSPNGRSSETRPPYRILTVARLTPKKGLPTVLRALALLKARGLSFRYLLVGAGEEREKLETLTRELGIQEWVNMPGAQPHEKVREEYGRAHVFVLASRITSSGDRDGIPNVLTEAMAMGVPVVATAVSALPELVEHGATGLLVPPDNALALAEALEQALTDQPLRQRLIPAAQERVRNTFDNRLLIKELAGILRREIPGA